MNRIEQHPILQISKGRQVKFQFCGRELSGYEGETIAAALHAAGLRTLHESAHKHRPRGLFCAIGNCSSCLMKVNGQPNVRVCVEPLREGMMVEPQIGLQAFDLDAAAAERRQLPDTVIETDVLVVGGGPAGMCAALEAARHGVKVILAERSAALGGQLVKQTHKFFGSEKQQAGTRGITIAEQLYQEIDDNENIDLWLDSTVLGYFQDGTVMTEYQRVAVAVKARAVIIATGAFEKNLVFPNNDLPGVYGAGAVQTLMNVEGIVPGDNVLMVGAGNIGLIVSYQLLQAGVNVAAVIEGGPRYGGYEVHALKLQRASVPIITGHTIKYAYGKERLEGAVIQALDDQWQPVPGTERDVKCDVMCMAVGLSPLVEIFFLAGCEIKYIPELGGYVPVTDRAQRTTIKGVYAAGDAGGVEEASSAMLTGRIAGLTAAEDLGLARDYQAAYEDYNGQLALLRLGPHAQKIREGLSKLQQGEGVQYGK